MRLLWCSLVAVGLLMFQGCGGRGLTSNSSSSPTTPLSNPAASSAPATGSSPADLRSANMITVSAGSKTSAVDIVVAPTSGSSSENAIALGTLADGFAANTGVVVHQASTNTIVLFGPGVSGSSVAISGPQDDIGISNIRSIQAKDGTSGLAFDAVIGATSAPGARTIYLKANNNDVTAFTGGLEVQP